MAVAELPLLLIELAHLRWKSDPGVLVLAPHRDCGCREIRVGEATNSHYNHFWSDRAVPKNRTAALGAEVFFDGSCLQRRTLERLVGSIDRDDVIAVEEAREPKGAARSFLALQAIAKRHAPGFAVQND
jgi:hypothetical protein